MCREFAQILNLSDLESAARNLSELFCLLPCRLENNNLGPEGAKALAPALAANGVMTECTLKRNGLGDEGWTLIFNALRDNPSSKIATWNLGGENLGPEIAKPLAEYISVSGELTNLS